MHAVVKTGGKQYRVAANDVIEIEKISGKVGDWVQFADVLMVGAEIGKPKVAGASIAAEIIEQGREDKVIIFKKRRRKNSRRKKGHRQEMTAVRITEILTGGKAPSKTAIPALWNAELGRITSTVGVPGEGASPQQLAAFTAAGGVLPIRRNALARAKAGVGRKFELLSAPIGGKADELGLISGVADKTEHVLNEHGIYHFWQIAAMTDEEAEKVEHDIKFHGRIRREEWREQARELMAGKASRAKVDRDRAHDHGHGHDHKHD